MPQQFRHSPQADHGDGLQQGEPSDGSAGEALRRAARPLRRLCEHHRRLEGAGAGHGLRDRDSHPVKLPQQGPQPEAGGLRRGGPKRRGQRGEHGETAGGGG